VYLTYGGDPIAASQLPHWIGFQFGFLRCRSGLLRG
jgi:hypothetical protein